MSRTGLKGGQLRGIWPGVEVEFIFDKGRQQRFREMGTGGPLPQAGGLVEAGRESPSLHLGLGEGVVRAGLPRPRLWPSTVPGLETLGRGAQSPGQSCLVLSQASGARHLRGSGQQGLWPNFKASEGKGTVAGSWGPRAGVLARVGR